jgi:hypothetical protein
MKKAQRGGAACGVGLEDGFLFFNVVNKAG